MHECLFLSLHDLYTFMFIIVQVGPCTFSWNNNKGELF